MRTKARRYAASVAAATFTNATEIIGVSGDFDGGFVQVNAAVFATPGAGNYINAQCRVDGVAQGASASAFQSGLSASLTLATTLRVPQGRHRISVVMGSNAAPMASSSADLSVAELNA